MKRMLIYFFTLTSFYCFGQSKSNYIFFYKPYTDSLETNLYKDTILEFDYNIQYENIKNANVENDVKTALSKKDFRIIAISGNSYLYPGLEDRYGMLIKKFGFKVIQGTSDAIGLNDAPLQGVAYDYAKKYNLTLLERIQTRTKKRK